MYLLQISFRAHALPRGLMHESNRKLKNPEIGRVREVSRECLEHISRIRRVPLTHTHTRVRTHNKDGAHTL